MMNEKLEALKKFLVENGDFTVEELQDEEITDGYNENIVEVSSREYMVLTDKEADREASDYINDSVWAFNSNFIIQHSNALDYDDASKKVVKAIQDQYENGNEAMKKLIDDMDKFVQDAIEADGRGHFLNTYDGEEYEAGEFYIYRMN